MNIPSWYKRRSYDPIAVMWFRSDDDAELFVSYLEIYARCDNTIADKKKNFMELYGFIVDPDEENKKP